MDRGRIALVTLGCARNEVDSEELAGNLAADGWEVVADSGEADVIVVNTCGFIESAKQESIETLLAAHESAGQAGDGPKVVAVGCMAQRYGQELARALPEADAVLGFDAYPELSAHIQRLLDGQAIGSHDPGDRRTLLPVTPLDRSGASVVVPGHAGMVHEHPVAGGEPFAGHGSVEGTPGWHWARRRLSSGPVASLKIASGCDRRCAFCAIPAIRGLFVSRPVKDLVAEARWLVDQGVTEIVLVSENSTSFGKDFGVRGTARTGLEDLLESLDAIPGLSRIRVSYLQPAEIRPSLIEAMTQLPRIADYFDLSFQHASEPLLRRMRRFGGSGPFLELLGRIRELAPEAGIRSNFILGFPGETAADLDTLAQFLQESRMDAIGLFGYSDEEGTEGAILDGKVGEAEVAARVEDFAGLVDELMAQRAEERIGTSVSVLAETVGASAVIGRAQHQGPEDASTEVRLDKSSRPPRVGELVNARVVGCDGIDLIARVEINPVDETRLQGQPE